MLQHILRALQIGLSGVGIFLLWNLISPLARGLAPSDLPALELAARQPAQAEAAGDYQVIGSRNLFKAREAAPTAPVAEVEAAPTQLRIQLLGTVAGGSEASSGIIRDGSTSKVEVIQVGDSVAGGQAKVVRIERRRILVDHAGVIEAVQLEDQKATRGLSLRTASNANGYDPSHGDTAPDRMRQLLEQRMAQNLIQKINAADEAAAAPDPAAAAAGGAPAPARFERSDNGAISAIQMQQVSPDSGLARLGFAPGDRLVALDGVRLNDPAMPRRFATLLASDRATVVEVERGGVPTQIQIPADSVPQLIREIGVAR